MDSRHNGSPAPVLSEPGLNGGAVAPVGEDRFQAASDLADSAALELLMQDRPAEGLSDDREALDALQLAVAVLGEDGRIRSTNLVWDEEEHPFPVARPPKAGDSYLDLCTAAAAGQGGQAVSVSLRQVLGGAVQNTVVEYVSGTGVEARWTRTRVRRSSGRGVLVTHFDITESMRNQEKLAFQASLLDAVGQSIVAVNRFGVITYWNKAAEDMLGWTSAEAVGAHILGLGIIENTEGAAVIVARVSDGERWSGEHRAQHRDGRTFSVYSTITPLRNDDGEVTAIIDVSTDVSELRRTEAEVHRLSALVESSNDAINGATLDGIITSWNLGAERLYGYSAQEAIGSHVSMLTPESDSGEDAVLRSRLKAGETVIAYEVLAQHKDGSVFDVALTFSPVYDADGILIGSSAIARDITEVKRLSVLAELERDRLIAAQEMAHVGSVEVDMITGHRWWSDEYFRIHGLPLDTVATEELWLSLIHPEDRPRVEQHWRRLEDHGHRLEIIHRIVRPAGDVRWVQTRATAEHDAAGVLLKLVETVVDITDRKVAELALERLAYQDSLTGLTNRARLIERIDQALADVAPYGGQVAVLFLDVNRFKVINDGLGHAAGDSLLKQLADRLRGAVRPTDTLARFAGDEFVIVSRDLSEDEAQQLATRIQQTLQAPFTLLDREVFASISVGIALSKAGDKAESLLHDADTAMYRSKEAVLSAPVVFEAAMHHRAELRLDVESQLPRAIERGELRVLYQPILDVRSLQPIGFEALIRWQHPKHGLIAPGDFIPVAEETGLIVPIGAWILNQAIRQAQQWRSEVPGAQDVRISINLSARQLQDPGLVAMVREAIASGGIDPNAVELEITESVLMRDADQSLAALSRLRELGVRLSIDDFGTGYSSLGYLKRFPVTALKIDRSFVDGLSGGDVHAESIVGAITGLAHAMDLDVVAEGVETPGQLRTLSQLNATQAQGYLWAKPLAPDVVPQWLARHPE